VEDIYMDEELYEEMYEDFFNEYSSHHDFSLLDLIEDEDAIILSDCSSYEIDHDPKCIDALGRLNTKK
jgi:hypothetical protein